MKTEIEEAKTFWSQNSKDYETWWVSSNDRITFWSDDLWKFMNAYKNQSQPIVKLTDVDAGLLLKQRDKRIKELEAQKECNHEALTDTGIGYYHCPTCNKGWTYDEWNKQDQPEARCPKCGYTKEDGHSSLRIIFRNILDQYNITRKHHD